ncbi:MAG: heme o synthase [Steroidobacteraceae bacterium]
MTVAISAARSPATPLWRCYLELTKPKIVALVAFTALVGALLARPGLPPPEVVGCAILGIALSAQCAAVLNHVFDRHIDERMTRTCRRPLPTGRVAEKQAIAFAAVLGVAGGAVLVAFVNVITAALTVIALIGYGFIYTVWLKRATPQNIVLGGAAGAAPPVLGWTAVTGHLELNALVLFLIIFLWTPPHFWPLAIARRREYARACIPMLPVTHGVSYTRSRVLLYTILLSLVTALPVLTGMSGAIYLGAALVLDGAFLYLAVRLRAGMRQNLPMRVFYYSLIYLPMLFSALLIDHCWRLPL